MNRAVVGQASRLPPGRLAPGFVAGETPAKTEAVAKVSGVENFVGSLYRNLCRIGHFSTKASTKFATQMQNQHFRNRL